MTLEFDLPAVCGSAQNISLLILTHFIFLVAQVALHLRMRIAERTARTDVDIRLYAEKAAFEALVIV